VSGIWAVTSGCYTVRSNPRTEAVQQGASPPDLPCTFSRLDAIIHIAMILNDRPAWSVWMAVLPPTDTVERLSATAEKFNEFKALYHVRQPEGARRVAAA
jgi:hypothetical protein